ncbi:SPOR domain-containing protein [Vibrio aerogenes]|nr:SPOR domain-containing protein [Vibrio aerogenes]
MSTITKSILGGFVLCGLLSWTQTAQAQDEFLCDATQESTQKLPLLDKSCPIGQGLWGKSQPKRHDSVFWIQCGIYAHPMPLTQAKVLYKNISSDVWMKPESKGYRCLIGPYESIIDARQDLKKIRKLPSYKQSFIREVMKKGSQPAAPAKSKAKLKPKPKAAPVKKPPVKRPQSGPAASATASRPAATHSTIQGQPEVRKRTVIAKVNYAVPFVGTKKDTQFYMEYNKPWNRLSYDDAKLTCQKIGMKLASEQQWQRLRMSKVMEKDKWPVYLPYWGRDKKGLFASGKVTQLKGTSLLNVLCVDR